MPGVPRFKVCHALPLARERISRRNRKRVATTEEPFIGVRARLDQDHPHFGQAEGPRRNSRGGRSREIEELRGQGLSERPRYGQPLRHVGEG